MVTSRLITAIQAVGLTARVLKRSAFVKQLILLAGFSVMLQASRFGVGLIAVRLIEPTGKRW